MRLVRPLEYLKLNQYISCGLTVVGTRCVRGEKLVIRLLNKGSIALKGKQYCGFGCLLNILYVFYSSEDLAGCSNKVNQSIK